MTSRTIAAFFVALLTACGKSETATAPAPQPGPTPNAASVDATPGLAFNPSPVTIAQGGTITFAFGSVPHNVYFDATPGAPSDIPGSNSGSSVTRTFASTGTFSYSCHIHPGMRGTIVVGTATGNTSTGDGY